MSVNVINVTRNDISVGSDKKWEMSAYTPIVKIIPLATSCQWTWRYQSQQFLQWGSMGNFLIFCRIQLKYRCWLHKKSWHTSWKFQLEIRSNKKVIAKKRLTNLYEMNIVTILFNLFDSLNINKMKTGHTKYVWFKTLIFQYLLRIERYLQA